MAMTGFFWGLFLFILIGTGWLLLVPFRHLSAAERIGTSFVIGSVALPFLFFLLRSVTHMALFGPTLTAKLLMVFCVIASVALFWSTRGLWKRTAVFQSDFKNLLSRGFYAVLLMCVGVFFYQVYIGLQKPIFGWDEYSFWLSAAKSIYLHQGSTTTMLSDAYNTYPLGFPYLVALAYQWTGGIAITTAKWLSAILSSFMLLSMYHLLRRLHLKPLYALLAVTLTVWGSRIFLWYNFLAFGEMSYVDTYALGVLYLVAWLSEKDKRDLWIAGLLLGLSCFLRVDGMYIAAFTLVLFGLSMSRSARKSALQKNVIVPLIFYGLPPIIVWEAFKMIFHAHGWTTRISVAELSFRLQPWFLQTMWQAIWHTVSNISTYPIMAFLAFLIIVQWFYRSRATVFLTLLALAQIGYLFVAYLTVFSRFEALHASSMDRYLLRIDPMIAVAFALLVGLTLAKKPAQHRAE